MTSNNKVNRASKRQRKENPKSWLHNHSLTCVASPFGGDPIRTEVVSTNTKEVFLERLEKEIVIPLNLYRGKRAKGHDPTTQPTSNSSSTCSKVRQWPKTVVIGANQCTRVLQKALAGNINGKAKPKLIVLARDIYPPTILSHVLVMAHQLFPSDGKTSLPVLLLPGKASQELGKVWGPKHISVVDFLSEDPNDQELKEEDNCQTQQIVSSFLKFVTQSLLPS